MSRQPWNPWAWLMLGAVFFWELARSVKDVALTVINPERCTRSAIAAVPIDLQSPLGITILANMITLTPGTTSLHVSDDRKTLYVHVMNLTDDGVEQIKLGFEKRIRRIFP